MPPETTSDHLGNWGRMANFAVAHFGPFAIITHSNPIERLMKNAIVVASALSLFLIYVSASASIKETLHTLLAEETPLGDVNGDGNVDATDVSALLEITLAGGEAQAELLASADITGDGYIDSADVAALLEIVLTGDMGFDAPTGLAVTDVGSGWAMLQWNATADTQSYNIYRSADGVHFEKIGSTTTVAYIDVAPLDGASYYAVTAVTADGESSLSRSVRYPPLELFEYNPATDIMVVYNVTNTSSPTRIFTNPSQQDIYDLAQQMEAIYIDGEKYEGTLSSQKNFGYIFDTVGKHTVILRLKSSCTRIGYWTGWLNDGQDASSSGGYATEIHYPSQLTYYYEGSGIEDWYVTDVYSYRVEAATSGWGWIWNSSGTNNSMGMKVSGPKRLHVPKNATGYATSSVWSVLINTLGYQLVYDL